VASSLTWSSKHADRQTGEASEGDNVPKLRPSRVAPMSQAVDFSVLLLVLSPRPSLDKSNEIQAQGQGYAGAGYHPQ